MVAPLADDTVRVEIVDLGSHWVCMACVYTCDHKPYFIQPDDFYYEMMLKQAEEMGRPYVRGEPYDAGPSYQQHRMDTPEEVLAHLDRHEADGHHIFPDPVALRRRMELLCRVGHDVDPQYAFSDMIHGLWAPHGIVRVLAATQILLDGMDSIDYAEDAPPPPPERVIWDSPGYTPVYRELDEAHGYPDDDDWNNP